MIPFKKVKYYSIIVLFSFFSCKKEEDGTLPIISIETPFENQTFNVFDQINVKAIITDETQLKWISVKLLNDQQAVAHVTIFAPVTSPSTYLNINYALDNIHLESGVYSLNITASDGVNDAHAFKRVSVIAVPKEVKKRYIVTATTTSNKTIAEIDSTFSLINPYQTLNGDFLDFSANSYHQQLFICGNYSGAFTSTDLETNSIKFSYAANPSAYPFFTGYLASEKLSYVAFYDGYLRGYNNAGNIIYSANANAGYYIQKFTFTNGQLLAEQKEKITGTKILTSYKTTGIGYQQTNLNQDVVAFCERNAETIFIFGNNTGQGVVQLFDRTNNNIWNPYPFSLANGPILSAIKIDLNTYLIGHSNGTIYKYQYNITSATPYLTGYVAKQLIYDDVKNELYVVEENKVNIFNYSNASFKNSITSTDPILDFDILYNR